MVISGLYRHFLQALLQKEFILFRSHTPDCRERLDNCKIFPVELFWILLRNVISFIALKR